MSRNERFKENIHPKFELIIGENELERFEADSEGGPVVGFVRDRNGNVLLVTLDHNIIIDPTVQAYKQSIANRTVDPVRLRYTPEEWVAFYSGVKDGEFQDLYDNPYQNLLKDSKQTDGPIFVIVSHNWRPWMDALQGGKYDIPKGQEESILEKFERNKDQQLRQMSEILSLESNRMPQFDIKISPGLIKAGILTGQDKLVKRLTGQEERSKAHLAKLTAPREFHGSRKKI